MRRLLFWLLLSVFAALAVWWALSVPYNPARLYTAIPANASYVSRHDHLADRWKSLVSNPLGQTLFSSLGVKPEALRQLATDPDTEKWLRRLAPDEVILAYVPSLGFSGKPAWVFASWIGGYSQRLRWDLAMMRSPQLKTLISKGAPPIWMYSSPLVRSRLTLSFALTEGMLLGCLSSDPGGARYLAVASDGSPLVPSLASAKRVPPLDNAAGGAPAADHGWVAFDVPRRSRLPASLAFSLSALTDASAQGSLFVPDDTLPRRPSLTRASVTNLVRTLGDSPQAFCLMPASSLRAFLPAFGNAAWVTTVTRLLESPEFGGPAPVFAALLGDSYSGRIKSMFSVGTNSTIRGLKVPTLVVGVRIDGDAANTPAAVLAAVDRLNAANHWGLIPHPVAVNAETVTVLDDTVNSMYGKLALEERVAYVIHDGWLFLCSNEAILAKLLTEQAGRSGRGQEEESGAWAAGIETHPAGLYAWADLDAAGKTLKDALAAYSLALLVKDASGSLKTRQDLSEARAWLETFRPLKTCQLWCRPASGGTAVDFQIGEAMP